MQIYDSLLEFPESKPWCYKMDFFLGIFSVFKYWELISKLYRFKTLLIS